MVTTRSATPASSTTQKSQLRRTAKGENDTGNLTVDVRADGFLCRSETGGVTPARATLATSPPPPTHRPRSYQRPSEPLRRPRTPSGVHERRVGLRMTGAVP